MPCQLWTMGKQKERKTKRLSRNVDQRKLVGRHAEQTALTWRFLSLIAEHETYSGRMDVLLEALPHYRALQESSFESPSGERLTRRQHAIQLDRIIEEWVHGLNLQNTPYLSPFAFQILKSLNRAGEAREVPVVEAIATREEAATGRTEHTNDPLESVLIPPRPDPTRFTPTEYQVLVEQYQAREREASKQRGFVPEVDREKVEEQLNWLMVRLLEQATLEKVAIQFARSMEEIRVSTVAKALNPNQPRSIVSALPDLLLGSIFYPKSRN